MKVQVFLVLTHVLFGTYSITVPPVWPTQQPKYRQPTRYYKTYHNRPSRQNAYRNQHPPVLAQNQYKTAQFTTESYWMPVTPNPIHKFTVHTPQSYISQTFPGLSPPPRKILRKNHLKTKNYHNPSTYQTIDYSRLNYVPHADKTVPFSPVRGSYAHKIPLYNPEPEQQRFESADEKLPEDIIIKPNYNSPVSEHEVPKDVPTKPIYPGEGQWARPGIKHRPYVDTTKYSQPLKEDSKSDGYDIFERGEERFKEAQQKFKFQPVSYEKQKPQTEETQDLFEDVHKNKEEDFVPQKLYAQVRRTETKKHVPRSEINSEEEENAAKLKEIIKDSKIQTVYSEEGYEDSAYDHAGHHKKAESEDGHSYKGGSYEKGGKKSTGGRKSQREHEIGHNRGGSKYRRTKDRDELTETSNFDNLETYDDVKKQVEREGNKKIIDSESAGASDYAIKVPLNRKVGPQRNSQTGKDMKKIEIKSTMKNGDDINMEIHTEVKFLNGSDKKKQKFVKIVPSYKQSIETGDSAEYDDDYDQSNLHTRVKRYNKEKLSKVYVRKRPNYYWKKTKATAYGPAGFSKKVKAEFTTVPNGHFSTTKTKTTTTHSAVSVPVVLKIRKRYKRYAVDDSDVPVPEYKFENVQDFPDPTPKPDLTHVKYPYFKMKHDFIHEHSPLRYAENLKKIPVKTNNKMAFYDSTSGIECPVVEDSVDPIPDRIKNKKSEDDNEEEIEQEPVGPRLKGLGDKIDCMKAKYFGENPLDSPIFSEDEIKIAVPKIFEKLARPTERDEITKRNQPSETTEKVLHKTDSKIKRGINRRTRKREAPFEPIVVLDSYEHLDPVVTNNPINVQTEAVLKPPYTFKEMVKKLNAQKNRHDPTKSPLGSNEEDSSPEFLIVYRNSSAESIEDKINGLTPTTTGYIDPRVSDVIPDLSTLSQEIPNNEIINLVPENFTEHDLFSPQSYNPSATEPTVPIFAALVSPNVNETNNNGVEGPKYLPIIVPITRGNLIDNYSSEFPARRLSSFIFDISKYLPQIKNHKVVTSEVQYKDEIKPSEQMNVYTDVLKSINISTQEVREEALDIAQPITVKLQVSNGTRIKYPKRRIRIRTTPKPGKYFRPIKRPPLDSKISTTTNHNTVTDAEKITPQVFPTEEPATRKPLSEKIKNMISQYGNPLLINVPDIDYSQEIRDLSPPDKHRYRTIPPNFLVQQGNIRLSRHVNTYFVPGLRPPPEDQEPINYNDFLRRRKRDIDDGYEYEEDDLLAEDSEIRETYRPAPKKMYTEIVRSRPAKEIEEEDDEEEEDLRPRKRVYDIKPRRTTATEKEPEYVDIEEEKPTIEKPVYQPPVYEKPTGLPEYIKLIDKLHEFWIENNVTTTLPEQETTTANPRATTTTTAKTQVMAESINVRRGEPSYLQIIDNLHQLRKEFDEKNPTTTIATTTEQEYPSGPVQNSNPYLPEPEALTSPRYKSGEDGEDVPSFVRNLSSKFRTNIDTSKYKTIERSPIVLRHNLSSRYNADDEVLPLEKMFTTKMPLVYTTTMKNIEKEIAQSEEDDFKPKPRIKVEVIVTQSESGESEEENESEEVATVTTTTTTAVPIRRQRVRTRPTTTKTKHIESTTGTIVRRRRPLRARTTTTETPTETTPTNRRRYRQKLDSQTSIKSYVSEIPPNHKSEYVPVTELRGIRPETEVENQSRPSDKKKRRLEKTHERRLTSEYTSTKYYDPEIHQPEDDKKSEFEIIATIENPAMRHGGNYRHIDDTLIRENIEQDNEGREADLLLMDRKPMHKDHFESTASDAIITDVPEKENEWRPVFPNYDSSVNLGQKNTLARSKTETNDGKNVQQDGGKLVQESVYRPKIIKDPSKRRYFYAQL